MQNEIAYSRPVTLTNILRFAVPTIAMSVFMSFYTMVDGLFVSNLIGTSALSALNLVYPVIALVTAISTMLATGGSAAIMRKMGEGKPDEAKQDFTFLILVNVLTGLVMCGLGYLFMGKIFGSMSLSPEVSAYCWEYLSRYLLFTVPILLMNNFTLYMIAAGKASLSLLCSVAGGVTNIVLDYLFIAVFGMGLVGAAIATVCGECIGGFVPLIYFAAKNSSPFRLGKTKWYPFILKKTCTNGSSELMTNLSSSIVNTLFNFQLMRFVGENGVAAYGTIMYVNFIFVAIYFGYSIGSAPIVSYHYGAQNHKELKNLLNKSLRFTGICGIFMFILAQLIATPLARIFVGYDVDLFELTRHGFRIYCTTFLVCGLNIYGSSFFTALNNGLLSALISFLRTLVFQVSAVLILPIFFAIDGIWSSVLLAELLTLVVTAICIIKKRSRYHYF